MFVVCGLRFAVCGLWFVVVGADGRPHLQFYPRKTNPRFPASGWNLVFWNLVFGFVICDLEFDFRVISRTRHTAQRQ